MGRSWGVPFLWVVVDGLKLLRRYLSRDLIAIVVNMIPFFVSLIFAMRTHGFRPKTFIDLPISRDDGSTRQAILKSIKPLTT